MSETRERVPRKVKAGILARPTAKAAAVTTARNAFSDLQEKVNDSVIDTLSLPNGDVGLTLRSLPASQLTVWEGNSRSFRTLTEEKIGDILPSISETGIQKPLYGRPGANGMFEVIDGSRRLFAHRISKRKDKIKILIGSFTDAQARMMTVISNNGERLSPYEMGMFSIEEECSDTFKDAEQIWTHLGIKQAQYYRCKKITELPQYVKDLFGSTNEIPSFGINSFFKAHDNALSKMGEQDLIELTKKIKLSQSNEQGKQPPILKLLISGYEKATKTKQQPLKAKPGRSVSLKNSNGETVLKVTETTSGTLKLEILPKDKEIQSKILGFAKNIVGLSS